MARVEDRGEEFLRKKGRRRRGLGRRLGGKERESMLTKSGKGFRSLVRGQVLERLQGGGQKLVELLSFGVGEHDQRRRDWVGGKES